VNIINGLIFSQPISGKFTIVKAQSHKTLRSGGAFVL